MVYGVSFMSSSAAGVVRPRSEGEESDECFSDKSLAAGEMPRAARDSGAKFSPNSVFASTAVMEVVRISVIVFS